MGQGKEEDRTNGNRLEIEVIAEEFDARSLAGLCYLRSRLGSVLVMEGAHGCSLKNLNKSSYSKHL